MVWTKRKGDAPFKIAYFFVIFTNYYEKLMTKTYKPFPLKDVMKLILVRHGETEENARKIIQGHGEGNLSKKGILQAKKVAIRLKDENIDKIYVSDLKRAVDTAKEIIKYHPNAEVIYEPRLREQWYGTLEGKPSSHFWKALEKSGSDILTFKPGGGESIPELKERVIQFFSDLIKTEKDNTVLLVTHGGPIGNLLLYILNLPNERFKEYHPKNTAVSILKLNDGEIKIETLNCTEHLE
ncbi:MAG TPA: histidine phosphatase family protein [Methanomicrobia archaeon]|nr:histidine phosphatase family protein [Methanomicrobia archaeon]